MITGIDRAFFFEQLEFLFSWFPDLIGCLGAVIVLIAYGLLQAKKVSSASLLYSFLNLIGALMILISLFYAWNLPAFLMEAAWILITIFGIFRESLLPQLRSYKSGFPGKK